MLKLKKKNNSGAKRLRKSGASPSYPIRLHGVHRVNDTYTLLYTIMGICSHNSHESIIWETEENKRVHGRDVKRTNQKYRCDTSQR